MNNREKWELKLTILTIVGMLISGIISGYAIYYVTLDKSPMIIINPSGQNNTSTYNLIVSNLADNPASLILLKYRFNSKEDTIYTFKQIPFLSRGTTIVSLDMKEVQERVIEISEKSFSDLLPNNYQPFGVAVGDEFGYNSRAHMFDIIISAECNNCESKDIIIDNKIIKFVPKIMCQRFNVINSKNFTCWITSYQT